VLNLDAVSSLKDDALMCFVGDADTASRAGLEAIWRQRSWFQGCFRCCAHVLLSLFFFCAG
jgi:hypothetical protein